MVFPGADYSRFSHSLGVCHITQRLISALKNIGISFSEEEQQQYRLAGLLHDVGHYPFSHAMEDAIAEYYSAVLLENVEGSGSGDSVAKRESLDRPISLNHESVGKEVLERNEELKSILVRFGHTPEDIYGIFAHEKPNSRFANLISSDLDADRIDYLLRTARHTGLSYGAVDLGYLLGQLRVDGEQKICIHPKALRTADHFLLGRYFDYQQVVFNKTVAALECVLRDVIRALLQYGLLDGRTSEIRARINSDSWSQFDDASILQLIRSLIDGTGDQIVKAKGESILLRRPPKLVANVERLTNRDIDSKALALEKQLVLEHKKQWAQHFGISEDLWYIWESAIELTKIGPRIPISALATYDSEPDKARQAIRVYNPRNKSSISIMEEPRSLMSVLSDRALYALRVYVLLPKDYEGRRQEIEDYIRNDLHTVEWAD